MTDPAPPSPSSRPVVLAATSLAAESDPVLTTAAAVARRLGASLEVAHAFYVTELLEAEEGTPARDGETVEDYGARPEAELGRQLDRLRIAGEVAARHVRPGSPHRVLAQIAERRAPALIVVGGAEEGANRRGGLGSTAARLLARVACPVLVVHRPPALPPERVLAAVDLSPLSAEALAGGLAVVDRLAAGGPPPRLEVVYALDPRQARPLGQLADAEAERIAGGQLERFVAHAVPDRAARIERRVVAGDPTLRLVREIAAADPDLVVLGTHGRGGFERFLLGSVASAVAAQAPKAALVVPPAAARQTGGER